MIPLVHDLTDARVLVFGGGSVGARKARRFAAEADVLVVSREFGAADFGGASRVRASVEPAAVGSWLDRVGPAVVVAATDDTAVNEAIDVAARDRGILLNRADRGGARRPGSVVVPATVRDGPILLAISTEGVDPALARGLRVRLEAQLGGSERVADALGRVTELVESRTDDPDDLKRVRRAVASADSVWEAAADAHADPVAAARAVAEKLLEDEPS